MLAACGDDVVETTTSDSSSGESTASDQTTTSNPTTTTPTTTTPTTTTPTTTDTTAEATTGTTVDTDSTDTATTTTTTETTDTTAATTATTTTGDTDTDTDTDSGGPVCDNGVVEAGEACDSDDLGGADCISLGFDAGTLACADDCATLDDSGCMTFTCGDGSIQGNEVCDGTELGGQDCVMQGFEDGVLACADNCGSFDVTGCFKCGDDLVGGQEVCDGTDLAGKDCASEGFDDGVLACAADCGALDVSGCFSCGDNVIAGSEVCDGTDLGGKTCMSEGFEAGTLSCAADCGALDTSACSTCGDAKAQGAEECDGADLKAQTCATQGADFGTLGCANDCTFSLTNCITAVDESEPNDDGNVAVATNDFSAANADGPFTADTLIAGAISPAGDDDFYAVTNNFAGFATLRAETFGPGGPGTCVGPDTVIEVRSAANTLLISDDDAGISLCSLISGYGIAPGETLYVRVIDLGDNAAIASYFLDLQLDAVVCGDGNPGPGEQCDDGNLNNNDGCSATCTLEGVVTEIEPNNTNAQADANGIVSTGKSKFSGAITPVGDLDRYKIDLAAASFLRFESFSNFNDCSNMSTALRLFNAANTQIIADTATAGISSCSALTFPLPAGVSYLQIEETGNNAVIPAYLLEVAALTDVGTETEPNEAQATASTNIQMAGSDVLVFGDHSMNADSDFYAINVPVAGSSLRLEIIEGDRAVETCEGNSVDSRITLFNGMGTQLVDDDDEGRGFCSLIDGTGNVPLDAGAHNLAAGTYYVQVRASSLSQNGTAGQFTYRLAATIRKP